jgi:heme/copper-type cytochrome/quinol oxidase subunit 3
MTATALAAPEPPAAPRLDQLPPDAGRGTMGMALAIVTESLLFVVMFFAYFYIGHGHDRWPVKPPALKLALVLLGVLLASSFTLGGAEHTLKRGARAAARALLFLTILLGVFFTVLQTFEFREHLRELTPASNAYGSLFYVITGLHALHVVVGLLMLVFVACLSDLDPPESPHRPLHNAGLYWHFVDVVWIFVVGLLYLLPRWVR